VSDAAVRVASELPLTDSAAPPAIRVDRVSKVYKIYDRPLDILKEALTGRVYHREKPVLKDISFSVERGEIVGVVGRNGAGKSTLLKLIAGTLSPSSGSVFLDGRVSAILELGTGFNPQYSGRENVILSAQMRGLSEAQVREKFGDIVAFAGLEDVIDEPFHTYSSGMQARLAFAAAVAVDADILIIDEALAAGDARFAARSLNRMRQICQSGVSALFVSHQTYQVMQLCSRAIWIDDGQIRMEGPSVDVARAYEYEMHELIARDQGRSGRVVAVPRPLRPLAVSAGMAREDGAEQLEPATPEREATDGIVVPLPAPEEPGPTSAQLLGPPSSPVAAEAREEEVIFGYSEAVLAPERPTREPASDGGGGEGGAVAVEGRDLPRRFTTGRYRIVDIAFFDQHDRKTETFRFNEVLKLQVSYECLMPELPEFSCGLAVAFNRTSDFEAVMYFNTNYPHSDNELQRYFDADYRKYVGRSGIIEARIEPLQLRAGEYYVSLGILPNHPGQHEFYEYLHCEYRISVIGNGFDEPSVFYPMVSWTNRPPT